MMQKFSLPLILLSLVLSSPSMAYEAGDIILRMGPTLVTPGDDSDSVLGLAGTGVEVEDDTQLGLTVTYMLKSHLGLELLAATPFSHDVSGNGGLDGLDVGSLKLLPPTLSLVYYPMDSSSRVQPYVGLGVNYTWFFETETDSETEGLLNSLTLNDGRSIGLDVDDSVGVAFRAGVDYQLNDKWSLNAGLWYIDIDTTATLKTSTGNVDVDIEVDPFVYMVGLNYNF